MALGRTTGAAGIGALLLLTLPASGAPAASPTDPAGPLAEGGRLITRAPSPTVTLAEVASPAGEATLPGAADLLRRDVEAELATIDWAKEKLKRPVLLSAAVVRLEAVPVEGGGGAVRVACTVSATVRDAERGTLLAIVEGRARTEDAAKAATDAARGVLAGAARGAIRAVPEAIRRTQ